MSQSISIKLALKIQPMKKLFDSHNAKLPKNKFLACILI